MDYIINEELIENVAKDLKVLFSFTGRRYFYEKFDIDLLEDRINNNKFLKTDKMRDKYIYKDIKNLLKSDQDFIELSNIDLDKSWVIIKDMLKISNDIVLLSYLVDLKELDLTDIDRINKENDIQDQLVSYCRNEIKDDSYKKLTLDVAWIKFKLRNYYGEELRNFYRHVDLDI